MQTTIQNKNLSVIINHRGAELTSLIKNGKNYLWEVDTKYWDKVSPVLFPVIGGLKYNSYEYEGKKYQLPRHGFARECDFELVENSSNFALFSLKFSKETLKVYPFEFELQISYLLEDNELIVRYKVINLSSDKMYYSLGAHPGFAIEGNFQDYTLVFEKNENLQAYQLHDNLFSGKTKEIPIHNHELPLNYDLFVNDAIVLKDSTTKDLLLLHHGKKYLQVNFSQFPYLGIWTKVGAPFICVEPWLGIADNHDATGKIEEKEGIQVLEENSEKSFSWTVEIFD